MLKSPQDNAARWIGAAIVRAASRQTLMPFLKSIISGRILFQAAKRGLRRKQ
jgi:hypothetical protein